MVRTKSTRKKKSLRGGEKNPTVKVGPDGKVKICFNYDLSGMDADVDDETMQKRIKEIEELKKKYGNKGLDIYTLYESNKFNYNDTVKELDAKIKAEATSSDTEQETSEASETATTNLTQNVAAKGPAATAETQAQIIKDKIEEINDAIRANARQTANIINQPNTSTTLIKQQRDNLTSLEKTRSELEKELAQLNVSSGGDGFRSRKRIKTKRTTKSKQVKRTKRSRKSFKKPKKNNKKTKRR